MRRRRHPLEVTSDRLADAAEKYHDILSSDLLDAIGRLRHEFEQISETDEGLAT